MVFAYQLMVGIVERLTTRRRLAVLEDGQRRRVDDAAAAGLWLMPFSARLARPERSL